MKSRVVLVADADKEWRDAKLCRFVRDAEENPILTFTKWNGKTGRSRWLAIRGHQLCEVQRIDDIRSLFAPRNVVVQDGSLLVVTPMDPLFLLLEQLAHWTRNTQFCALHDIMESCGIPLHGISRWNASAISNLCDIDGSDDRLDILCVRRNDTKITAWLRKKVDRIQALGVAPTRSSSNDCTTVERFQRPPDEDTTAPTQPNTEIDADDKHRALQTAISILSEYLDECWTQLVVASYGLSPTEWLKKIKTKGVVAGPSDIAAKYDARQQSATTPAKRPAPASTKSTLTKKKTPPVTGMKSIASFFGK
ncbi:hypothetical protein, variant 2 [Aphanomyces invadans]|uniref:Uncharacterized protein n=3 Tax=Aphanomyces invadans TaxID=157072 RepID=A0A024T876_9STRA|nr:hypothetical protein, variant 2 [Aphanomyces invadans]ETV90275.1 hypothetical protein, variant 2 [Aphanomyces invadans]|eukprot:XP_008881100.1 hypothetical protein, variant 2 [Aphanomyces invadans]